MAHLCIFVLLRNIPGDSVLPVKMKVAPGCWFLIIKRPWAQLVRSNKVRLQRFRQWGGHLDVTPKTHSEAADQSGTVIRMSGFGLYRSHTWLNFQWLLFTVMLCVRCNAFSTLTSPCGSELEGSVSDVNFLFVAEFELGVAPMALAFLFMPGGTDPGWRTRWQVLLSKCAQRRRTSPGLTDGSMWRHKTRKSRHSHFSSKLAKVAHNEKQFVQTRLTNTSTWLLLSVTGRLCSHYSRNDSFIILKPSSWIMLCSFRTPGWDAATVGM